jgi:hypothetical protein
MRAQGFGRGAIFAGMLVFAACAGDSGGEESGEAPEESGETSVEEGAEGDACGPEVPCGVGLECIHEICMAPEDSESGETGETGDELIPGEGDVCTEDEPCPEGLECISHVCAQPGGEESGEETGATTCPPDCPNLPTFEIMEVPENWEAFSPYFSQYIRVFGLNVFATASVPADKVRHAAHVMAQYIDNDENGIPDDEKVMAAMLGQPGGSSMVMFASEAELESSGIFESTLPDGHALQDLYADETHPEGSSLESGFDATLEEVLHLVTSQGWSKAYPEVFGEEPGTALSNAMDLARGGLFMSVPAEYPEGAWYHYDDTTCDYECMATEYFYWALTSLLGAQEYPGRCEQIANEWEPCTEALMEEMDPGATKLLKEQGYALPRNLPDGSYGD